MRGFVGFGGALVTVPVLSVVWGPQAAVAITGVMGIPSLFQLLPEAVRYSERPIVIPVALATFLTAPIGSWVLVSVDPKLMSVVISGLVIAMVAMLAQGWTSKIGDRPAGTDRRGRGRRSDTGRGRHRRAAGRGRSAVARRQPQAAARQCAGPDDSNRFGVPSPAVVPRRLYASGGDRRRSAVSAVYRGDIVRQPLFLREAGTGTIGGLHCDPHGDRGRDVAGVAQIVFRRIALGPGS